MQFKYHFLYLFRRTIFKARTLVKPYYKEKLIPNSPHSFRKVTITAYIRWCHGFQCIHSVLSNYLQQWHQSTAEMIYNFCSCFVYSLMLYLVIGQAEFLVKSWTDHRTQTGTSSCLYKIWMNFAPRSIATSFSSSMHFNT